jgi:DNA repair protein RadC
MDLYGSLGCRMKLSDKELLKELLYTLRVKGDVDTISESAIHEFGNISAVLRQSHQDLMKIKGFTPTTIKRLKLIYSLFREIIKPDSYPAKAPQTFQDLSYFMLTVPRFDGESLRLLFLDENHTILKDHIYKKGFGNQVTFYFREVAKEVLKFGISNIVLIHHKLGSTSKPSSQEKVKVKGLEAGFKGLDITLVDYLIATENSLFSFKNNRVYPSLEENNL